MRVKKFTIPIYEVALEVHIMDTHQDMQVFVEYFNAETLMEIEERQFAAQVWLVPKKRTKNMYTTTIIAAFNMANPYDKVDHGVIAHECLHIVHYVMGIIDHHSSSDEPSAYLMEYLFNRISKIVFPQTKIK